MQNFTGRTLCLAFAGLLILSCNGPPDRGSGTPADDPVALALAVAQEYVDGFFHQFPEEAYWQGYPDAPDDRLGDHSPSSLANWRAREDAWLETLGGIDSDSLAGTEASMPYAFVLERLEASRQLRSCRLELWNVNPTAWGWLVILPEDLSFQIVGNDEARAGVLSRARDVARFVDTDIANLRDGLSLGYVAPRSSVEAALRVTNGLLEGSAEESPFYEPAVRDGTDEFADSLLSVVDSEINPAIRRYRDFLSDVYLPAARESIAAIDTPGGDACYAAAIRLHTSLTLSPSEIHEIGRREMERLHEELRLIGRRSFGIDDPKELFEHVRTNPTYRFESEQEILDFVRAAVERGKEAVPDVFGFVPEAEVVVMPYPDYLKRTGGGMYTPGTPDGSVPARYVIGTHEPTTLGKAEIEATTFHETYFGHHLQKAVILEAHTLHPALRYFVFNGTNEGLAPLHRAAGR